MRGSTRRPGRRNQDLPQPSLRHPQRSGLPYNQFPQISPAHLTVPPPHQLPVQSPSHTYFSSLPYTHRTTVDHHKQAVHNPAARIEGGRHTENTDTLTGGAA